MRVFCIEQLGRLPCELDHVSYADLMDGALAMSIIGERRAKALPKPGGV